VGQWQQCECQQSPLQHPDQLVRVAVSDMPSARQCSARRWRRHCGLPSVQTNDSGPDTLVWSSVNFGCCPQVTRLRRSTPCPGALPAQPSVRPILARRNWLANWLALKLELAVPSISQKGRHNTAPAHQSDRHQSVHHQSVRRRPIRGTSQQGTG
jgi:hypothetical protein